MLNLERETRVAPTGPPLAGTRDPACPEGQYSAWEALGGRKTVSSASQRVITTPGGCMIYPRTLDDRPL